jgi:hypothetical protein
MFWCVFTLLYVLFLAGVYTDVRKTSSSINKDAVRVTQLSEKLWS